MKRDRIFSGSIFGVCLIVGIFCISVLLYFQHQNAHKTLDALMEAQAAQMETRVSESMLQVYGLQALVIGANGGNVDLSQVGPFMIHENYVRNVLLAPNGVVNQVYPLDGNEGVLGLNLYSPDNKSYQEALKARETGELVITGPYDLVQGGEALSGRLAVFLPSGDGMISEWGMVSVTLDFPAVMEGTSLLDDADYRYCLYKLDPETNIYHSILNHGYVQQKDYESITFSIQSMDFRLDAYPASHWLNPDFVLTCFLVVLFGSLLLSVCISFSISQRKHLHERATKDALTGLLNRETGTNAINRIIRTHQFQCAAFLLIDIDHFKNVNDILGHQVGDQVLVESAQLFSALCRSTDVVCRLGGDEFVIFLPYNSSDEFLSRKITHLLEAMDHTVAHNGKSVHISCSVGISAVASDGSSFTELYLKADQALYHAKERGRNCASYFRDLIQ